MEITWLGRNCFRIKGREGTVITDPCPPDSGYKLGKQTADVVTVSSRTEQGYSYTRAVTRNSGEPAFVLDAPGEFEVGGILITGVANPRADGARNVCFICELDGIRVGHLGLPTAIAGAALLEELSDVDILLIPVGGGNSLAAPAAAVAMTTIDPHIAIPMNYRTDVETAELDPLERFIKETGIRAEPQPMLRVTKSQLPADLTVMFLQPRA
ncbi:MAG: MBL fold metallo-hydrolase [Chloroflexi bacterium]|nr:MBL fold metallo-hydrolase [Chloroflexota bacterium]